MDGWSNKIKRIFLGTFRSHSFIDPLCDYVMILIRKSDFHYTIERKKGAERKMSLSFLLSFFLNQFTVLHILKAGIISMIQPYTIHSLWLNGAMREQWNHLNFVSHVTTLFYLVNYLLHSAHRIVACESHTLSQPPLQTYNSSTPSSTAHTI